MKRLMTSLLLFGALALHLSAAAQDFTMVADPSVISVNPGESGQLSVNVTRTGGFAAPIVFSLLSVSPSEPGVTATFVDPPFTPPEKLMTISVAPGTPARDYVLTVQGAGGGLTRTTTVTLKAPPPDFSLQSVSPSPAVVVRGGSSESAVTTLLVGGFDPATITYDITSTLPIGVTVAFSPSPIPPLPGQALTTMTVTATAGTALGSYPVTVRGSGGGKTSSLDFTLDVVVPYFTVGFDPPSANLRALPGGSVQVELTATWQVPGYDAQISFAELVVPAGILVSFRTPTDIPVPPGSYVSEMTVTAAGTVVGGVVVPLPAGVYRFTIRGTGAGADPVDLAFNLQVTDGTLTLALDPVSAAVIPGGVASSTLSATTAGGFSSQMELSVAGLPAATTVAFVQTSPQGNPALSFQMTITTTASTPKGTYPLVVQAKWSSLVQTVPYTLIVSNADFTIRATPATVFAAPGTFGTTTVATVDSGTLNSPIALSVTGLPAGVTAAFVPAAIPAPGTGSSLLTLTVASGAPQGTYTLQVVGTAGGITRSTPVTLNVVPPFSVVAVSPAAGLQTGGTVVTISGFGFEPEATVTFGGSPATSVVRVDARTITAVTPAHLPGVVDVVVTNEETSSATLVGGFTYTKVPGQGFFTLAPCRAIDTRTLTAPPMYAGERRNVLVTGGACGVPATARSLAVNLAVVYPEAAGYITLFRGDLASWPNTSTISFSPARVRANNAIVSIGADGTVGMLNASAGTVNVIVDVVGYFE